MARRLEVLGGDSGRDGRGVGALVVGGVGAPAGGFEGGGVDEAVVDGEETLAYAVGDFVEVARAELVRDQPGDLGLADGKAGMVKGGRTLPIESPTW